MHNLRTSCPVATALSLCMLSILATARTALRTSVTCSRGFYSTMDRPRNRQPRLNNHNQRHSQKGLSQIGHSNVPTSQQVIPGASVSIVLKADQPTGREVQGVVKDLLSHGDHPRGIKVRLQDGRIGRVQRMTDANLRPTKSLQPTTDTLRPQIPEKGRRRDEDSEGYPHLPPSRTLADFLPAATGNGTLMTRSSEDVTFSSAVVKCPICGLFEGDEDAVSHHVQEHLD